MISLREAYRCQVFSAKVRGISWLLTYEEWLKIWVDSGHLHERGRRKGQYCMSRFRDKGPYAIGNVRIVVVGDNHREAHKGKELEPEVLQARIGRKQPTSFVAYIIARNTGRVVSAESRAKSSASQKGRIRGPLSIETRRKMSESKRARDAKNREAKAAHHSN